ncbi:MAG: asparagine synthase (glutamine-hydrolyzing) [Chloroflexi bacterium]|nr:asparagine synthase (glutamine-hydrolyzing) [Chloroflexota bacterium]
MCGLFGVYDPQDLDKSRARKARDILQHRGPDQSGEWIHDGLYMGQRRLSIIDLSDAGRQPMVTEDKNVAITVNGEIYNFKALRTELEKAGYTFFSQSDSEVALYGYQHWGLEGLAKRIEGMYIVIIFDAEKQKLFAIRDRVGIKPLYYFHDGHRFAWASELKALTSWLGKEEPSVDESAIFDFLTYRFIPAPKSLYRGIYKLPAASLMRFSLTESTISVQPYWSLSVEERDESHTDLRKELVSLLEQNVEDQLISDVPLGFLLSGGIDSSIVTYMGAKEASQPLTFYVDFTGSGRTEAPYAKEVATLTNSHHRSFTFLNIEMENLAEKMANWFDEPFGDTSCVPTYLISEFARRHVTVVLSGDGGDELFGGYPWYADYKLIHDLQNSKVFSNLPMFPIPSWLPHKRLIELLQIKDPIAMYARLRKSLPEKKLILWSKKLGIPGDYDALWAYRAHFNQKLSPRKAAQVMDFHTYLPDDILTKVDRVSMAVGLECRPPLLSTKIVEFAFGLPEEFIYKNNLLKGGLKYSLEGLLPGSILYRKKQGFSVPDFGWKSNLRSQYGSIQEALLQQTLGYE